jgi:hypothetical protein
VSANSLSTFQQRELLDRYVNLSIERGRALELCESSLKVNRLGDLIFDVNDELKRRAGDRPSALSELLSHPNAHVRYNAATGLIGALPNKARQVIQEIADTDLEPLASHARMYLSAYDGDASRLLG